MILYAESSGVLSWLLGEPEGDRIREALVASARVLSSQLTLVECERAFIRGLVTGRLSELEVGEARGLLAAVATRWAVLAVTDEVLQLARQRLVHEPVRTLDAIHLASCRVFHRTLGTVSVLSLDDRIRANAQALGMGVVPS